MRPYDPIIGEILERANSADVLNRLIEREGDGFMAEALQRIAHELSRRGNDASGTERTVLHQHACRLHDAAMVLRANDNVATIAANGAYVCLSCRTARRDAPTGDCTLPFDHTTTFRTDEFGERYPTWKGATEAAARELGWRMYGLPWVDGVRLAADAIVVTATGEPHIPMPTTYRGVPLRVEVAR